MQDAGLQRARAYILCISCILHLASCILCGLSTRMLHRMPGGAEGTGKLPQGRRKDFHLVAR